MSKSPNNDSALPLPPSSSGDAITDFLQQISGTLGHTSPPTFRQANGHDMLPKDINDEPEDPDADLSDADVAELLKQMTEAEVIATGLEGRLDGLLENLEGMLEGLEGARANTASNTNSSNQESSDSAERPAKSPNRR